MTSSEMHEATNTASFMHNCEVTGLNKLTWGTSNETTVEIVDALIDGAETRPAHTEALRRSGHLKHWYGHRAPTFVTSSSSKDITIRKGAQ